MRGLLLLGIAFGPLGAIWAQTAGETGAKKPDGFAPLAYFEENCARCHGPNGSFYGAEFGKGLKDDAALKQIVKEMCEGPGNAPLDEANLEILTEFHRSLRDDRPFVTIVSRAETGMAGESSPDAKVTLESGEKSVAAEQNGNKWSVNWPVDFEIKGAKVVARRGEKSAEVGL